MLVDVREPLTREFHKAKGRADMLRPQIVISESPGADEVPGPREGRRRRLIRSTATRSWTTPQHSTRAEREARRRKQADFSPVERESLERARRLVMIAADEAATPAEKAGRVSGARRAGWFDRTSGSRRRAAGALRSPESWRPERRLGPPRLPSGSPSTAEWVAPQPPSGSPSTADWVALNRRLRPPSTADWAVRLQIRRGDELQEMAARILADRRLAHHVRCSSRPPSPSADLPRAAGQRSFHMVIWRRPTAQSEVEDSPVGGPARPTRQLRTTQSAVRHGPVGYGAACGTTLTMRPGTTITLRLTVEQRDDLLVGQCGCAYHPRRRRPRR